MTQLLFMPQGGVEPPVARFLRPPRLPFRHCGDRPFTVQCSAQDSNLHSLSRTGTSSPCVCQVPPAEHHNVAGRARTFILRLRKPALNPLQLPRLTSVQCPEQDSNLHPKGGASETPASTSFRHRGFTHYASHIITHAPSRTRTRNTPVKSRRLCR